MTIGVLVVLSTSLRKTAIGQSFCSLVLRAGGVTRATTGCAGDQPYGKIPSACVARRHPRLAQLSFFERFADRLEAANRACGRRDAVGIELRLAARRRASSRPIGLPVGSTATVADDITGACIRYLQ